MNQRQRKAVTGSGFAYCPHGWQPWKAISRQAAARQCGQKIFQITCRVQSIGLCGLNQRIDHRADLRAKRRIAEQPVLFAQWQTAEPNALHGCWTAPAVRRRKRASASSAAARHKSIDARKGIGLRASKHASDTHNRLRLPVQLEAFSFSDVIAHRSGLCSPPGSFPAAASFRCSPPQRPRPAKAASAPPLGIAQARFHRPAPCPKGRSE